MCRLRLRSKGAITTHILSHTYELTSGACPWCCEEGCDVVLELVTVRQKEAQSPPTHSRPLHMPSSDGLVWPRSEWPSDTAISLWNPVPTSPPTFCSTATPACVSPCSGRPVARMGSLGPMLFILCQRNPAAQPEVQCGWSSLGHMHRCPHRHS